MCLLVDALTLAWDEMEFESFYTNQTSKQLVQQPNITARWASKKKDKAFSLWSLDLSSGIRKLSHSVTRLFVT